MYMCTCMKHLGKEKLASMNYMYMYADKQDYSIKFACDFLALLLCNSLMGVRNFIKTTPIIEKWTTLNYIFSLIERHIKQ